MWLTYYSSVKFPLFLIKHKVKDPTGNTWGQHLWMHLIFMWLVICCLSWVTSLTRFMVIYPVKPCTRWKVSMNQLLGMTILNFMPIHWVDIKDEWRLWPAGSQGGHPLGKIDVCTKFHGTGPKGWTDIAIVRLIPFTWLTGKGIPFFKELSSQLEQNFPFSFMNCRAASCFCYVKIYFHVSVS